MTARLMAPRFAFTVTATSGRARTGTIAMQRGDIRTPAFMPVGTAATVKAMKPQDVRASGADILLGNTYHLMLRPSAERVARALEFPSGGAFRNTCQRYLRASPHEIRARGGAAYVIRTLLGQVRLGPSVPAAPDQERPRRARRLSLAI